MVPAPYIVTDEVVLLRLYGLAIKKRNPAKGSGLLQGSLDVSRAEALIAIFELRRRYTIAVAKLGIIPDTSKHFQKKF